MLSIFFVVSVVVVVVVVVRSNLQDDHRHVLPSILTDTEKIPFVLFE